MLRRLTLATLVGCLSGLLSACNRDTAGGKPVGDPASKLTQANYDRIQVKMPLEEVQAILGPGKQTPAEKGMMTGYFDPKKGHVAITYWVWQEGKRRIRISFIGDKVATKEQEGL